MYKSQLSARLRRRRSSWFDHVARLARNEKVLYSIFIRKRLYTLVSITNRFMTMRGSDDFIKPLKNWIDVKVCVEVTYDLMYSSVTLLNKGVGQWMASPRLAFASSIANSNIRDPFLRNIPLCVLKPVSSKQGNNVQYPLLTRSSPCQNLEPGSIEQVTL